MSRELGNCVVTLDLETPAITIHVLFGDAVDPGDGNPAINHRELQRILDTRPTPEQFLTAIGQDLDDLDFE